MQRADTMKLGSEGPGLKQILWEISVLGAISVAADGNNLPTNWQRCVKVGGHAGMKHDFYNQLMFKMISFSIHQLLEPFREIFAELSDVQLIIDLLADRSETLAQLSWCLLPWRFGFGFGLSKTNPCNSSSV